MPDPLIPLLAGVRIVVGISSYNGTVTLRITGDYDTAPDLDVLCKGIEDGVAELLALASWRSVRMSGNHLPPSWRVVGTR